MVLAVARVTRRDLGHLALGDLARVEQRRGLHRGEAHRVGAERREIERVHLHRVDVRGVGGGRPSGAHRQRDVDVAEQQPHPRLVQRPRAVHLDVRVALRRPRADGVDVLHERERLAGHVVAAAGAGEVDLGAGDAGVFDGAGHDVEQQLRLGLVGVANHRRDAPADDRDVVGV